MGVIAQEERGFKKDNYVGLIGPLIETVKELDDRLTALEANLDR